MNPSQAKVERLPFLAPGPVAYLELHLTNACNQRCDWCAYAARPVTEVLPFSYLDRVAILRPQEVLIVGGGEPTLYRDGKRGFADAIRRLREVLPLAQFRLITNGTYIPPGDWRKEVAEVSISLDRASRAAYAQVKGKDLFDVAWSNIWKYLGNVNPCSVRVTMIYRRDLLEEALALAARLYHHGLDLQAQGLLSGERAKALSFRVFPMADDRCPEAPYADAQLSEAEKSLWMQRLERVKTDDPLFYAFCEQQTNLLTQPMKDLKVSRAQRCWQCLEYALIGADGLVYPCFASCEWFPAANVGSLAEPAATLRHRRLERFCHPAPRCRAGCRPQETFYGLRAGERLVKKFSKWIREGSDGYVFSVDDPRAGDVSLAGGKGANLHILDALFKQRRCEGCAGIPATLVLSTRAFKVVVASHPDIRRDWEELMRIAAILKSNGVSIAHQTLNRVGEVASRLQQCVQRLVLPVELEDRLFLAWRLLGGDVAVRSSVTVEDGDKYSCAGQATSVLHVMDEAGVRDAVRTVWASFFDPNFIFYQVRNGIPFQGSAMAVVMQTMVPARASGVMLSKDEIGTQRPAFRITANLGLGEVVVSGGTRTDMWLVSPDARYILEEDIAPKSAMSRYAQGGLTEKVVFDPPISAPSLSHSEVLSLARLGVLIRDYYRDLRNRPAMHVDVEYVCEEKTGMLWIVQTRPVTSPAPTHTIEVQTVMHGHDPSLKRVFFSRGYVANPGVASGRLQVIADSEGYDQVKEGVVLVVPSTTNRWNQALVRVRGVISDLGDMQCHTALACREPWLNIPALVGTGDATEILAPWNGQIVTLDSRLKMVFLGQPRVGTISLQQAIWVEHQNQAKPFPPSCENDPLAHFRKLKNLIRNPEGEWFARPLKPYGYLQLDYYDKAFAKAESLADVFQWPPGSFAGPIPDIVPIDRCIFGRMICVRLEHMVNLIPFFRGLTLEGFEFLQKERLAFLRKLEAYMAEGGGRNLDAETTAELMSMLVQALFWSTIVFEFNQEFQRWHLVPQEAWLDGDKGSHGFSYRDLAKRIAWWRRYPESQRDLAIEKRQAMLALACQRAQLAEERGHRNDLFQDRVRLLASRFKLDHEDIRVPLDQDAAGFLKSIVALGEVNNLWTELKMLIEYHLRRTRPEYPRVKDAETLADEIARDNPDLSTLLTAQACRDGTSATDLLRRALLDLENSRSPRETVLNALKAYPRLERVLAMGALNGVLRNDLHDYIVRLQRIASARLLRAAEQFPAILAQPEAIFDLSTDEVVALFLEPDPSFVTLSFEKHRLLETAEAELVLQWPLQPRRALEGFRASLGQIDAILAAQEAKASVPSVRGSYARQRAALSRRLRKLEDR